MKRSGPPRRRAPLRSRKPAPPTVTVADSFPEVLRRSRGRCEAAGLTPAGVCAETATVVHHLVPRSRAPRWDGLHRPDNLAHLCDPCHRWVHHFPTHAAALDLLRSAPPPSKSVTWT